MSSELIALGDNGFFYSWSWKNDGHGSLTAHPFSTKLLTNVSFRVIVCFIILSSENVG